MYFLKSLTLIDNKVLIEFEVLQLIVICDTIQIHGSNLRIKIEKFTFL